QLFFPTVAEIRNSHLGWRCTINNLAATGEPFPVQWHASRLRTAGSVLHLDDDIQRGHEIRRARAFAPHKVEARTRASAPHRSWSCLPMSYCNPAVCNMRAHLNCFHAEKSRLSITSVSSTSARKSSYRRP